MAEPKLTGKIARERIRRMETPRPPDGIIEGFRALGDASGIVSDVMDELGITGVIGASVLKPTIVGSRLLGRPSRFVTSSNASMSTKPRAGMSIGWPSSRRTISLYPATSW